MWDCLCKKCVTAEEKAAKEQDRAPIKSLGLENTVSIRRYFLVPPGHVRVFIDFSQIELRVLAWFCQDPTMLKAYIEDIDLHQLMADELGITRSVAKQVNFGNSYGMTEVGLALRMPGYYKDPEGTRRRAKKILDDYFARFKRILQFRAELANSMRRNGGTLLNPFGRPRRIKEINSPKEWERSRAERQMMSSIISGTAADLMKESMIRCVGPGGVLERTDSGGKMAQTIHDEIVFDLPLKKGWTDTVLQLKSTMEDWPMFSHPTDGKIGVPIKSNVAITKTTWEAKRELKIGPDGTFVWG